MKVVNFAFVTTIANTKGLHLFIIKMALVKETLRAVLRQSAKAGRQQQVTQSYLYLRDAREIHTANRRNQQRWRPQCSAAASRLKSANGADECWLVHLAVKRSRCGEWRERKATRTRTTALSPLGFPFPALCKFHGNIFCAGQAAQPSPVILSKRIYCN